MYHLTFTLKQHTPIIHFQHQQEGATLRATELKPKLDKFIIEQVFGGKMNFVDYAKYLVGMNEKRLKETIEKFNKSENKIKFLNDQQLAFNYKLSLTSKGIDYKYDKKVINATKTFVMYKSIEGTIFSTETDLLKELKTLLPSFFVLHNFGYRQSKGYGCFALAALDGENLKMDVEKFKQCLLEAGKPVYQKTSTTGEAIEKIDADWKILKSGNNHGGYTKSKLFEYMCSKNVRWEKRLIKQELNKNNVNLYHKKQPIDCDNNKEDRQKLNYKFVRILLGLAENHEYLLNYRGEADRINKSVIRFESLAKDKIERWHSPVTFKVFDNQIFAIAEEIDSYLFDQKFKIEFGTKEGNRPATGFKTLIKDIDSPSEQEFDLEEFLDHYLPNLNYKKL